jgi:hypothetical protein
MRVQLVDVFSKLAAHVFGATTRGPEESIEADVLDDAIDSIVEAVEPRLRLVPRYRKRLEPAVVRAIARLRALAPALPEPVELSPGAWATETRINALFATAADVSALLGNCRELRSFYQDPANAGGDAAYALLVARREERRVLAPAMVDGVLRRDVLQTTLGFAAHRLVALAADPLRSRRLVGEAILRRIASLALERIVAMRERAVELDTRKGILAARLRMLSLRRDGLHELAPGEADPAEEIATLERELKVTAKAHAEARSRTADLDFSIAAVDAVFGAPDQIVGIDLIETRVDHLGYKIEEDAAGTTLRLNELWIGPNLRGVIVFVRVPRAAVPASRDRLAEAARYLG